MKTMNHHVICLAVDGLNTGLLGAYGNTTAETPGLDRLAVESALFDSWFLTFGNRSDLYADLWYGENKIETFQGEKSLPALFADRGYRTVLLTDRSNDEFHPAAALFSERILLEFPAVTAPAISEDETRIMKCFEALVQTIAEHEARTEDERPLFLWCDWQGLMAPWDFPLELREMQRADEDDPPAYSDIEVPFLPEPEGTSEKNSRFWNIDSDRVLEFVEAWKAGLALFDTGIETLLDFMEEENLNDRYELIVAGTRGFPLGEHGRVGFPSVDTAYPKSLFYGEEYHQPLFVRFPGKRYASVRTNGLCSPVELYQYLVATAISTPKESRLPDLESLASETVEEVRDSIQVHIDSGSSVDFACIYPEWYLVVHGFSESSTRETTYELYARPDDRYQVNEVSSRFANLLESLSQNKFTGPCPTCFEDDNT